jgi:hypothetical protein
MTARVVRVLGVLLLLLVLLLYVCKRLSLRLYHSLLLWKR